MFRILLFQIQLLFRKIIAEDVIGDGKQQRFRRYGSKQQFRKVSLGCGGGVFHGVYTKQQKQDHGCNLLDKIKDDTCSDGSRNAVLSEQLSDGERRKYHQYAGEAGHRDRSCNGGQK